MISWISQSQLDSHIEEVLKRSADAYKNAEIRKTRNVVDPFSSLVMAHTFSLPDTRSLKRNQIFETTARASSNAIGNFHQAVLGSVDGWENHNAGYDLECQDQKIIAEIKNKHNTMNAPHRRKVEDDIKTALRQKKGTWTGYLVHVIPKDPRRYKKKISQTPDLFAIDGASFYELVTGNPNAIQDLLEYMLKRISLNQELSEHCREIMNASLPPRK